MCLIHGVTQRGVELNLGTNLNCRSFMCDFVQNGSAFNLYAGFYYWDVDNGYCNVYAVLQDAIHGIQVHMHVYTR